MFTGLIESTGEVISFAPGAGGGTARLTIAAPEIAVRLRTGDSVGVNGVCLTALGIEPNAFPARFSADLAAETIARTTLPRLEPGSLVNLELPTAAGSPLGGHVVQGHVDGVGTLLALDRVSALRVLCRAGHLPHRAASPLRARQRPCRREVEGRLRHPRRRRSGLAPTLPGHGLAKNQAKTQPTCARIVGMRPFSRSRATAVRGTTHFSWHGIVRSRM